MDTHSDIEPISEDKQLALAFKRGEKGAYQQIHDRHARRVHGICRRMLANQHDAEEAAQESFLRVYTALGHFNGRYQLGAWIARITTNVCLDHIRAKSRRPSDVVQLDENIDLDLMDAHEDDPESLHIRRSDGRQVRRVLSQLPPMHRAAIILRDFEGLAYAEIALALEITEPQVKALLHRARCGFKRTWARTGVAAFLPWNLLSRFRRPEELMEQSSGATTAGHLAQVAAPISQPVAACATALQQCGQAITERFATVAIAVTVGAASITGVAASTPTPGPAPTPEAREKSTEEVGGKRVVARKAHARKAAPADPVVEVGPEEPAPEASPAPEPNAEPEPQPEPEPVPEGAPAESGDKVFVTQFGFLMDSEIPKVSANSETSTLDCATSKLNQRIESLISHGSFSYRAVFRLDVAGSTAGFQLQVFEDGHQHDYTSWGPAPTVEWSDDSLVINGEYGLTYGSTPLEQSELPRSGHFTMNVTLDCASHAVVTQGLTLTAE